MSREPRITADFETRSELDVRDVGAWRYAEHPSTVILILSMEMPDGRILRWHPGQDFPAEVSQAIHDGVLFEAHNVQFERAVWIHKLQHIAAVPRRWADTLAVCAYRALPLGLDEVGGVLDIDVKKDKRGKYLLQQLSSPRKPLKADKADFKDLGLIDPEDWPVLWNDDPDLMQELFDYCDTDVKAESSLSVTIGDLPPLERRLWILDQTINQRGVKVDLDVVHTAIALTEKTGRVLQEEFVEATGGEVQSAGQGEKLKQFMADRGYPMPNMQKATVEDALADPDLPQECYRVLEIRQKLARASTKKLQKIVDCTSASDGRLRGLLQYCGAGRTGRWSGRLVQPQNLINTSHDMDALIGAIRTGNTELIELLFDDVPTAIAESLRGMFIADKGKELIVADYSAIEARVLAWLAGEESKLDVFRQGKPVYETTAELIFGYKVTKKEHPEERQIGKICELALGYGGGVGAWRAFDRSDNHTDEDIQHYKKLWRARHPNINQFWYALEDAAIEALKTGKPVSCGPVTYHAIRDKAGNWLTCKLPSGRLMWYFDPRLQMGNSPIGEKLGITYQGRDNNKGGKWGRVRTYGGKLCLAGDTEVLTDRGWVDIVDVKLRDLLWDGLEWVHHSGLAYQGMRMLIRLGGIGMTADHEVLVGKRWVEAQNCNAKEAYATGAGLSGGCDTNGFGLSKESEIHSYRYAKPAYDLLDAGPLRRFMVRGAEGVMIVHNCENITQAVARDFMAYGMLNVEKHNYPILLTVHDEIISEVDEGTGDLEEFEALMAELPPWGAGCPIDAEGWRGDRYKKG